MTITIQDDQYVRNEPLVVGDASTESVEVPVVEAGTATVEVVDADGAVGSAIVQLTNSGDTVVNRRTDGEGRLATDLIGQGTYTLTVWKNGYLRNRSRVTVDGDVTRQVEIERASRLVTFSVADDHFEDPRPVGEATISVAGNTVTTLSSGEATIRLPVNSNYDVEVTKDGYETVTQSVRVRESEVRANLSVQRTDAISLDPDQSQVVVGQSVRVTVTDEYGAVVENASVAVGGQTVGETDANGQAVVPIDSAGENEIAATSGDLSATATVEGIDPDAEEETETPTATATPTATEPPTTTEPTSLTGPGFTGLGALIGVLLAVALLARRR